MGVPGSVLLFRQAFTQLLCGGGFNLGGGGVIVGRSPTSNMLVHVYYETGGGRGENETQREEGGTRSVEHASEEGGHEMRACSE